MVLEEIAATDANVIPEDKTVMESKPPEASVAAEVAHASSPMP